MKLHVLFPLALCAAIASPRVARADSNNVEVYLQVHPADQKDPKQKGHAPELEATIIGGPKVPLDKFSITTTTAQQKVTLKADKLRPYEEGTETIAIALVINGQEIWVGNEEVEPDPNAQYGGVLKKLEAAIDQMGLAKAGPAGSKATVISYSTGADIKVAMTDLKNVTGAALGGEKDYYKKIGTDMVQGISLAFGELKKVSTARKAMIVVGDGTDTNADAAKVSLADLKKQCAAEHIQMFGIIYKTQVNEDRPQVITTIIPNAKTVNSTEGIASELDAIVQRMADRYYLTFPGYDDKLGIGLPWDGKDHDLVIRIDQQDLDPVTMTLAPIWNPPKKGGFPWLVLLLIVFGGLLLIFIGVKVFGGKKEVPMPMPVAAPVAAPEPPKPAGPMKTVMIGAGGDQDGFPIVGWLVPLNGVDAYKTMKLRAGLTKIGTAPPADLVINDGFMSTEHCQITCSPAGFTLLDNGSTNGCYVNDRKIQKHDLVDNDMVTLGKTNFKFKSIN